MLKKRAKFFTTFSALFILLIFILTFTGCAKNNSSGAPTDNKNYGNEPGYDYATEENEDSAGKTTSTADGTPTSKTDSADSDRKVIYSATLSIETLKYSESISTLEKMIEEYIGYIQDSTVETGNEYQSSGSTRTATYVIRIPSQKLKLFLSKAGNIGNVIVSSSKGEDVTDQYYDTEARIKALTIQEERLLELLKKATTLKDIIDLEDRLSNLRYEIEQLTGTLNHLHSLVDMSTVTLEIKEVKSITAPTPEGFWAQIGSTFQTSVKALGMTLRGITLVLTAMLPFLLTIFVILLFVFAIYRFCTRKSRKRRAEAIANAKINAANAETNTNADTNASTNTNTRPM